MPTRFRPHKRFLIPRTRRIKIRTLHPDSDVEHHHHLAEVHRLRRQLSRDLEKKFGDTNQNILGDSKNFRNSSFGPNKLPAIRKHETRALNVILDLAGISRQEKRKEIHKLLQSLPEETRTVAFEGRRFNTIFIQELEHIKSLTPTEKKALAKATWDWLTAKLFFELKEHERQLV